MRLRVPESVTAAARAYGADVWLKTLPGLISEIENDWSLSVGRPYQHSSEAFVADVALVDGTAAALKLLIPRHGSDAHHEITVLRIDEGRSCARLLRDDLARGALLLERLGSSLYDLGRPLGERLEILVSAATKVWQPATNSGLPSGAEHARQLAEFIVTQWEELDHPCTEMAVEHALVCAGRRIASHDDGRAKLVHGDVHELNTLQVPGRSDFKLVDPVGLFAEVECELGVLMRNDPDALLTGDPWTRARWLASRCSLDAAAIWEWGVVERLASGLRCTMINLQPLGRNLLNVADRLGVV